MNPEERDFPKSEEEPETEGILVVESPEQLNAADDEAIIAMMTGQAIQEYVYSFRQGGKTVEGLTLAGINEAANRRGGIQVSEVTYEEREHSWLAIVKATDTFTNSSRYGAYEQPKRSGGREDPFAFTKAIHKAQRNAVKQLLPTPVIKEILNFYLRRGKAAEIPVTGEPAEKTEEITNQQKAAFSLAQRLREPLEKRGITQNDLWNYVRRRFHVESRNEMLEEHWTQLAAELRAASEDATLFDDFVKRIGQVLHAARAAEVPPEPEELPVELTSKPKESKKTVKRPSPARPAKQARSNGDAHGKLF